MKNYTEFLKEQEQKKVGIKENDFVGTKDGDYGIVMVVSEDHFLIESYVENTIVRHEISEESDAFKKFVAKKLKKYGVDSPAELTDKKKKKFFDEVDKEWNSDDEPGDDGKVNEEEEVDEESDPSNNTKQDIIKLFQQIMRTRRINVTPEGDTRGSTFFTVEVISAFVMNSSDLTKLVSGLKKIRGYSDFYIVSNDRQQLSFELAFKTNLMEQQEIYESAPPDEEIKAWTEKEDVKASFKQQYGDKWKERLYATAWSKYQEKQK